MSGAPIAAFTPLFLVGGAIVAYVLGKTLAGRQRAWLGTFAVAWQGGAFLFLLAAVYLGLDSGDTGFALLNPSYLGLVLGLLATGLGALAALASQSRLDPTGPVHLYYPLFLFAVAGVVAVGFANDLFTLFVMVEVSALPSYALVAYNWRTSPGAVSAAMKYLVQGVAGTVTALLGVGLLYVLGHTLQIAALPTGLAHADAALVGLAAGLVLVGYGVKLAAVPMHTWLPDAYSRAPAGVTAIMAGATKAGALVALFRTFVAIPAAVMAPAVVGIAVSLLALLTMTVGNLLALGQKDLRRMLAYSSVAQMGYVLLAFGIGLQFGVGLAFAAGLFYAVAYGIMKGGAFLAADVFATEAGSGEIARMRGLGNRHPWIGVAFAIFLLGLVGVPATAGFSGKILIVTAGMQSAAAPWGVVLALALVANSALSLGYYVPALSTLMFRGKTDYESAPRAPGHGATIGIVGLAVVTIVLGLVPQSVFSWIDAAARTLAPGGVP